MFCIAAFIVFLILGVFSAAYRKLAAKAWYCVLRKIAFKPCDINFKEEMKGKLLGKFIFTHPQLAKFLSKWIDLLAAIFVILSIWSLFAVMLSGLNLMIYDTCNPNDSESCSLGGEACSIGTTNLGLVDSILAGAPHTWAWNHISTFGDTLTRVPDRFRTWDAKDFLAPNPSYAQDFNAALPTTLEIIDPGCLFCAKLTNNIENARVMETHNVSYLLYPIPLADGSYKFANSGIVAKWIISVRRFEQARNTGMHRDWDILKSIFNDTAEYGTSLQNAINTLYTEEQTLEKLKALVKNLGTTSEDMAEIEALYLSEETAAELSLMKDIVEQKVRTKKIPTLLHNGRRFDRVVDVDQLQ